MRKFDFKKILKHILTFCLMMFSLALFGTESNLYQFKMRKFHLDKYRIDPLKEVELKNYRMNLMMFSGEFSLKEFQSEVKDQGMRGVCSFFASTALVEGAIKYNLNQQELNLNISEEYLIWYEKHIRKIYVMGDASNMVDTLESFKDGFVYETDMPYASSFFLSGMPCSNLLINSARPFCYSHNPPPPHISEKIIKGYDLEIEEVEAFTEKLLQKIGDDHQAVEIGLPVLESAWDDQTGHVKYDPDLREKCGGVFANKCGGHAIILIGYNIDKKVFIFKNSWSKAWGERGYGTIDFDYVNSYAYLRGYSIKINNLRLPPIGIDVTATVKDFSFNYVKEGSGVRLNYHFYLDFFQHTNIAATSYLMYKDNKGEFQFIEEGDGRIGRQRFFFLKDIDHYDFRLSPFSLLFPEKLIEKYRTSKRELYLRNSLYYMTDRKMFNTIYREFSKI